MVLCAFMAVMQAACAQTATARYSQKDMLKNWALSRCLASVYADPAVKSDANATAAAYLEFGHQPMAAYEALDALVDSYAKRKLSGSVPSHFNTMKCIDLYNSKELDVLAGKWAGKRQ
jgi:hypothetical protein